MSCQALQPGTVALDLLGCLATLSILDSQSEAWDTRGRNMTQRTDDHLELLLSCLRPTIDEIDYTQVAAECDIVTAAAAMKRYQRLLEDHDIEDTITALADETREKNRTVELLLASIKSVNGALLVDYEELMEIMDNPPNTPHAL